MTLSERLLWSCLKSKKLLGFDFDRQKPIDNFIVDFFCKELMLAIEIDGVSHEWKFEYDESRELTLRSLGIDVLRFKDSDVQSNLEGVVAFLEEYIVNLRISAEPTPIASQFAPPKRGDFKLAI